MALKKYTVRGVELQMICRGHYQCAIHGHGIDIFRTDDYWTAVDLDEPSRIVATAKTQRALVTTLLSRLVPPDSDSKFEQAMKQLDDLAQDCQREQDEEELKNKLHEQLGFRRPKAPWYTS